MSNPETRSLERRAAGTLGATPITRCLPLAWRQRRLVLAIAACMVLGALLRLPGPILTMKVIDGINTQPVRIEPATIHLACLAFLVVLLSAQAVTSFHRYVAEKFRYRLTFHLERALFRRILELPLAYHLRFPHGYLMSRIKNDPAQIHSVMADSMIALVGDLLTLSVGLVFLFSLHWRLALLASLLLPGLVVLYLRARTSLKDHFGELQENHALVTQQLGESLASVSTVKVFGLEYMAMKKFARLGAGLIRKGFAILRLRLVYDGLIGLLVGFLPVLVLWYGAFEILHQRLTIGQFIAFNGFLIYLYRPAEGIVIALLSMQKSLASIERIFEILDAEPEGRNDPRPRHRIGRLQRLQAHPVAVEFRDVAFRYPGKQQDILHDVSFTVRAGEFVAVTGASGVGKTTLLNLIPRLVEPTEGEILVHGTRQEHFRLRRLRRWVTLVSQETRVIAGSVRENIACGLRGLSDEAVAEAARLACAEEFILGLKDGYDTPLGEGGLNLSAGQRQRILLARALVRRPSVLILDEATSFLNAELEQEVLVNVKDAMAAGTVLCVSHRSSVEAFADRSFLLARGTLVEKAARQPVAASFLPPSPEPVEFPRTAYASPLR